METRYFQPVEEMADYQVTREVQKNTESIGESYDFTRRFGKGICAGLQPGKEISPR